MFFVFGVSALRTFTCDERKAVGYPAPQERAPTGPMVQHFIRTRRRKLGGRCAVSAAVLCCNADKNKYSTHHCMMGMWGGRGLATAAVGARAIVCVLVMK